MPISVGVQYAFLNPMAGTQTYVRHYQNGQNYYHGGHYEEALTELKKALVCQPDFPDAYYLISRIYTELKHYEDALSLYEKVVKFFPNDLEIQCEYAKTLIQSGQEKKGEKILKQILKMNPADRQARVELIRFYMKQDQYKKAQSSAEAGIKASPRYAPFYSMAGEILRKQGKLAKAQNYYELALELDPDHDPAKRGINAVVRAIENNEEAREAGRTPEQEAREEMVVASGLFAEGHYDQAIVRLLDLRDRPGVQREATMLLGLAFAHKGLYKRAHDVFLAFIKDQEPDLSVYYNLGLCLNRMGRYYDAIPYLSQALDEDFEYLEALLEMGYACLMTEQMGEARQFLIQVLKVERHDPRPYAYLARLAYDLGDRDKVAEFLKRSQTLDAECSEAYYIRGYIAVNEGKYREALYSLEKFLEQSPDHFDALKILGRTHIELNDSISALECFQAAASLNPADPECKQILQELSHRA